MPRDGAGVLRRSHTGRLRHRCCGDRRGTRRGRVHAPGQRGQARASGARVAEPRASRRHPVGLVHGGRDPEVEALLARPGLLTIALTGPERIEADFSFAVESDDRRIVQEVQETAYHVLWELVHVFFEHPGLLADACITCGDVAVEARVVAVSGATATIELDGAREQVAVDFVDGVAVGDTVLCHAGVALERIS
ncbi:MAG: HypC/HybG/HupF family hydrogenase formation chaperone [Gaiellaceae bacterium]